MYFIDSANKISYFFEKDALEENGKLKVDPRVALNKVNRLNIFKLNIEKHNIIISSRCLVLFCTLKYFILLF